MPRNMSFMLTTEQIRHRTKTVTRRLGWDFLKAGDILNAVVKSQGIKKGEKIQKLATIRVLSVRREKLIECSDDDAAREGFATMTGREFAEMFCREMKPLFGLITDVNRIEFEYVD